tara:strand:+ start:146 stop:628 length:483 start_codon:yes stop_codon:yes gene_type:complete
VIKEFYVKLTAIGLAVISPFIMIINNGIMGSLSQYWGTPFQPLFITSNIICSYFFFSLKKWKIPSFFLMLLTGFNCYQYQTPHNVFALCFYFACLYSLFLNKRFHIFKILFILSVFLYPYSILLGEVTSIVILCSFHLKILIYKEKLERRKMEKNYLPRQ